MVAVTGVMTAGLPAGDTPQGRHCMDVLHAGPKSVSRHAWKAVRARQSAPCCSRGMVLLTRGLESRAACWLVPPTTSRTGVVSTIAYCCVLIATSVTGYAIKTGTNDTQLGRRQPDLYLQKCLSLPANWLRNPDMPCALVYAIRAGRLPREISPALIIAPMTR